MPQNQRPSIPSIFRTYLLEKCISIYIICMIYLKLKKSNLFAPAFHILHVAASLIRGIGHETKEISIRLIAECSWKRPIRCDLFPHICKFEFRRGTKFGHSRKCNNINNNFIWQIIQYFIFYLCITFFGTLGSIN